MPPPPTPQCFLIIRCYHPSIPCTQKGVTHGVFDVGFGDVEALELVKDCLCMAPLTLVVIVISGL